MRRLFAYLIYSGLSYTKVVPKAFVQDIIPSKAKPTPLKCTLENPNPSVPICTKANLSIWPLPAHSLKQTRRPRPAHIGPRLFALLGRKYSLAM